MAREDRKRIITPAVACRTGGIHVWTNAVTNAARVAKCNRAIPRSTAPGVVNPEPVGNENDDDDDDEAALDAQHTLVDIIYQWTDPEEDWADAFGMLDPNSKILGTLMFAAILMKYQAESTHDVVTQRQELLEPQRSGENLVAYFRRIQRAQQRLRQAQRPVAMIDFLDTFKAGVSPPHKQWTSYLKASDITMEDLTKEVYDKGAHVDGPTDSTGAGSEKAAFPAKSAEAQPDESLTNMIATVVAKSVAAAFAARPDSSSSGGGRRRPPNKSGGKHGTSSARKDYSDYTCHYCQKQGHIARDCRQKRKDHDDDDSAANESAFPAVAFPAVATIRNPVSAPVTSLYDDPAICLMAPPAMDNHSCLQGYVWDWVNQEYVDPNVYPEILEPLIDIVTGITYASLSPLPTPCKGATPPYEYEYEYFNHEKNLPTTPLTSDDSPEDNDPAICLITPPPAMPNHSILEGYVWDWISCEYVDPNLHPEILELIIDTNCGITYTSLTPLPAACKVGVTCKGATQYYYQEDVDACFIDREGYLYDSSEDEYSSEDDDCPDHATRLLAPPDMDRHSCLQGYVWDWVNHEYVDPKAYPEILEMILDPATCITYASLTPLSGPRKGATPCDPEERMHAMLTNDSSDSDDCDDYWTADDEPHDYDQMHARVKETLLWPHIPERSTLKARSRRGHASRKGLDRLAHSTGMRGINAATGGRAQPSKSTKIPTFIHARGSLNRGRRDLHLLRMRSDAELVRAMDAVSAMCHAAVASPDRDPGEQLYHPSLLGSRQWCQ